MQQAPPRTSLQNIVVDTGTVFFFLFFMEKKKKKKKTCKKQKNRKRQGMKIIMASPLWQIVLDPPVTPRFAQRGDDSSRETRGGSTAGRCLLHHRGGLLPHPVRGAYLEVGSPREPGRHLLRFHQVCWIEALQ